MPCQGCHYEKRSPVGGEYRARDNFLPPDVVSPQRPVEPDVVSRQHPVEPEHEVTIISSNTGNTVYQDINVFALAAPHDSKPILFKGKIDTGSQLVLSQKK